MRILPSLTMLAVASFATACAGVPSSPARPAPDRADLERLIYARGESGGLRVRAASRGCTSEDSFDVITEFAPPGATGAYAVSLVRKVPDECAGDPLPNGVALFYARGELGLPPGARIVVRNPVGR